MRSFSGSFRRKRFSEAVSSLRSSSVSGLSLPATHSASSSSSTCVSPFPRFSAVFFRQRSMARFRVIFPRKVEKRWGLRGGISFQAE